MHIGEIMYILESCESWFKIPLIRTSKIRTSAHQLPPHSHIKNPHIRTSKSHFQAENRPFAMHA
jgi:hypothetical protein